MMKRRRTNKGRARLTTRDLPRNWREILISSIRDGKPVTWICGRLGICRNTHRRMSKTDLAYQEALARGIELAKGLGRGEHISQRGPKKILVADLPENWRSILMGDFEHGGSLEEARALLKISRTVHERLMKEDPDYVNVINEGLELSKAWWLKQGRLNLFTEPKSFNSVLWYMNMKNRWGWSDRQEHTANVSLSIPAITICRKDKEITLQSEKLEAR